MTDTPTTHLDKDQQRRAEALRVAREVLSPTRPVVQTGISSLSSAKIPDAIDLVNIAMWVMDGQDPWPATLNSGLSIETVAR